MSSVNVKWKWHDEGFQGILNCEGASYVCEQEAARIMAAAASAGGKYEMSEAHVKRFGHVRVQWRVITVDREAKKQCAENNVLVRSI